MLKRISTYWWCQIIGWGGLTLANIFFAWTYQSAMSGKFFYRLIIVVFFGLLLTHLMRWVIINLNVLQKSFDKQLAYFLGITIGISVVYALCYQSLISGLNLQADRDKNFTFLQIMFGATFNAFVTLLVWNLIYFIYHYVVSARRQQFDKLRLEALIKELELKTIKSHINPHFIFNALNSIRALVDENPSRARTAITELSNILRSSMQAEKVETVSFEKELNIVKDYLALEQIRFEERLKIKFEIDENTLDQQVPPMMLQTLVENAIKHGISKTISGGEIMIISKFEGANHELIVRNTGRLNGRNNPEGFGIMSTQNRIKLMFGEKANFNIKDVEHGQVEAKVILPV